MCDENLISVTREHEELKRGIGDILIFIIEAEKGKNHISMKNSNESINHILKVLEDKLCK